jgi:cytochrome c1
MAPVAASLLNGIFSFYISERLAKEQRRAQQDMLDAQFEIATQQEEARVQEREQRAKDVTSFLQYAAGKRGK